MENIDYQNAYKFAISMGRSGNVADFYAKIYVRFVPLYREEYEGDPEYFATEYRNKTVEEKANEIVLEKLKIYDIAKSWGHSDEWAFIYADDVDNDKDEAYNHIRDIAPETIYSEAYNEYIARGYSERFSTLMAKEMRDQEWCNPVKIMESIFLEYERLFDDAKARNKSDDFAVFYADYCCANSTYDSYGWTMAVLRENLQKDNKTDDYIKDVIWYLDDNFDNISAETLNRNDDCYWKIIDALSYADMRENKGRV